jgi:hypothetical protein
MEMGQDAATYLRSGALQQGESRRQAYRGST